VNAPTAFELHLQMPYSVMSLHTEPTRLLDLIGNDGLTVHLANGRVRQNPT
jgi:hypothetical protein